MDTAKLETVLKEIANHTERLKRTEDLIGKLLESQERSERYLEQMLHIYQELARPQPPQF